MLSRVTNDIDNISAVPAADAEPTADLDADGRRRADDDADHLAGAGIVALIASRCRST